MKRTDGILRAIGEGKVKEYHDARKPHRSGGKYYKKRKSQT